MKPVLLPLLLICLACSPTYLRVGRQPLSTFLDPDAATVPPVSAHRGGRYIEGKPENSMAVFRYVARRAVALIECDVQLSKDSVLVIMHDNQLDRTTTGKGKVADYSWAELATLSLKDDFGNQTRQRIPRLEQVLRWAKGKSILTLDVKRGVPWPMVVEAVREAGAENYVVMITYDLETAVLVHKLAPDLMISASIQTENDLTEYLAAGLEPGKLLAFTGTTPRPASLYEALRKADIVPMLGTMGRIDKRFEAYGEAVYDSLWNLGVMILATDHPVEAYQAAK